MRICYGIRREDLSETRLNRFLARAGVASRRRCDQLIRSGRVSVNGIQVTEPGMRIEVGLDQIALDGQVVEGGSKLIYIVLNKPSGYIVSAKDTHGRKTIFDLLVGIEERIFSVGRLDFDTEGVLLLTNDGELAFRLSHPRHEVEKVYLALVEGIPDRGDLNKLSDGVMLDDGPTSPAKVKVREVVGRDALLEIVLHEGRKRQVKRMCEVVGHRIKKLKRASFAGISVDDLPVGRWRYLRGEEVRALRGRVRLADV